MQQLLLVLPRPVLRIAGTRIRAPWIQGWLFAFSGMLTCSAHAQVKVYDKSNYYQRERMVITRWNKFNPDLYFFLVHNAYKRKDQRPLGPKGPYLYHQVAMANQKKQDEDYQESTETIRNKALVEDLSSQGDAGDLAYTLYYQDAFAKLQARTDNVLANQKPDVLTFLLDNKLMEWYNTEKGIIDDRIAAIHTSYMERGSRILSYQRIETDYDRLTTSFTKIVLLAKQTVNAPVKEDAPKIYPFTDGQFPIKTDQEISREVLNFYHF